MNGEHLIQRVISSKSSGSLLSSFKTGRSLQERPNYDYDEIMSGK